MIAIILGVGWSAIFGRFLVYPLIGSLWMLASMVFMPRYLAVGIGQDGLALTLYRVLLYSLFIAIVIKFIHGSASPYRRLSKDGKLVLWGVLLVSLVSCVGSYEHGSLFLSAAYAIEDVATIFIAMYTGWLLSNRADSLQLYFKYAVVVPILICCFLVIIEVYRQAPVLSGLINIDESLYTSTGRDFLGSVSREGVYRVKALFNNPLQLSEFAVYCLVFSFAAILLRIVSKKQFIVVMLCTIFIIYHSGSRSGFLIMMLGCSAVTIFYFLSLSGLRSRISTWLLLIGCAVLGCVMIYLLALESVGEQLHLIDDVGDRSTAARLQQYYAVFELWKQSKIYGYGYKRAFFDYFQILQSLDNYFLRIILQSGATGFAIQLVCFFTILKTCVRGSFSRHVAVHRVGFLAFGVFVATFVYKLFIESDYNNMYLLVLFFLLTFMLRKEEI